MRESVCVCVREREIIYLPLFIFVDKHHRIRFKTDSTFNNTLGEPLYISAAHDA